MARKIYRGIPDEPTPADGSPAFDNTGRVEVVETGQDVRELRKRLDELYKSPTGFGWAYGGSGPAQLAYAILRDFSQDPDFALSHYQRFKADVVARLPHGPWDLDSEEIAVWIAALNDEREGR